MFNYEIIVIDKTTNQLKRTTLEHLRAELDALSEASAMRVAVESEGRRVADMPGDMPGRDALIKQYGADYRVLPPPRPTSPTQTMRWSSTTDASSPWSMSPRATATRSPGMSVMPDKGPVTTLERRPHLPVGTFGYQRGAQH